MTPPINSVSASELLELARAFHDGPLMADDHEFVTDSGQGKWCLEVAKFFATELAARRAANTPADGVVKVHILAADHTVTTTVAAAIEDLRSLLSQGWTVDTEAHLMMAIEALSASPALPSQVVGVDAEVEMTWRDLALQFDGHRIDALSQLKYAVRCIEEYATVRDILREPLQSLKAFLAAPPLSGEKVLAARIQSCLTSPAAEPVGGNQPETPVTKDFQGKYANEGNQPEAWLLHRIVQGELTEISVSLFAISDGDRSLGWLDTPLYASPPRGEVTVTDEAVFAAMKRADELDVMMDDIEAREILTAALLAALPEREG